MIGLVLALGLLGGVPQAAADPCDAAKTDAAMLACRRKEAAGAAAQVTALTGKLVARAKGQPALVRAIQTASIAWTRYRDAQCAVETFESAGTPSAGAYLASCRTELDHAHAALLQHQIDNP